MPMIAPPRLQGVNPYVQTAIHEMGHALIVVGGSPNVQLSSIEIWEEEGHVVGMVVSHIENTPAGEGVRFSRRSWVAPEDLYNSCLTAVAGQMAEAMWLKSEHGYPLSDALALTADTAWFDMEQFHKRAERMRTVMPDISLRGCRAEASIRLRRRWRDVEYLGKRLANRHSLRPAAVA